jgi:DNA-binding LacI/PurR family transcriptional regulator
MTHLYPLEAMLHTARRLGYDTAFSIVEDPASEDELRERLCSLAPQLIDGLIVITPSGEVSTRELVDACPSVPMVLVGPEAGASAPSVIIDQGYGTRLALQHLHDLGHQRIIEICGPLVFHDAMARHQAYLRFMETHSLEPLTASEDPNWMPESGYRRVSLLLQRKTRFTAFFCANDLIALGALRALHENGLSVPEDVSVVGFDDASSAEYYIPPLTTVKQDFPAQGREAVQYLVQLIEESPTSVHRRVLDPQLIVRSSTSKVG